MIIRVNKYWLVLLIALIRLSGVNAQTTLNLYYGDPAASPDLAFDGNVFQVGSQVGDAAIYAKFGGTGTRSFQIDSPGENKTITVDKDGFFFIRPVASTIIDQSKIKNFSGTVTGSVNITVKPLNITTISANVATDVLPGSELTVSYLTGAGTFPVDLVLKSFKVQLLDASGNLLTDLLNASDQYSGQEKKGASFGGTRYIKATIPNTIPSGSYRVRVVTQGLLTNVIGSPSNLFSVRINTPVINAGSLTGSYCAGSILSFPFTTTGTFSANDQFKIQRVDANGNTLEELSGTSSGSPVKAVLPAMLTGGTYRFRVVSASTLVASNIISVSVAALPTMTLSGNSATTTGSTAPVRVTLTGTPPWSFSYTDYNPVNAPNYTVTTTTSSSSFIFNPTFVSSTIYDKSFIRSFRDNSCGTSELISGSAQISISQITITTGTLSGSYCPGSTISVPFTMSSSLPANVVYQAQLSDTNGNFQNEQIVGSSTGISSIIATIPQTLALGTGYKLRIIPSSSGAVDYSNSVNSVASPLTINRPEAPIVTDVSFCSGSALSQLTATGINLKWYSAGSSQPLPSAPIPPNDRSSQYFVSQTINGCESVQATLTASRKPAPLALALSDITLCQGAQGQFATSLSGALWYSSATGGVGSSQPPALNSQATGDQIVYITQTVDGCESPRAAVKATVNAIPSAPTSQIPASLCQYVTASPLSATGQNLTWYDQSGKLNGAPIPETSVSGTKSYSVSQKVNGCESPRATVEQIIRPAPAMPAATSVRFCVNELPRSLTANGSNLKWYTIETGGTSSATSPPFLTETPNVLTFYVTQTDNSNCESQRQPVLVSVLAPPSAPTVTTNQVVCQLAKVNPLTASPNTELVWQGTGIIGSSETAPTPSTTQAGTYTYVVTQKSGSCTSPASRITFTVRQLPEAPTVVSPVAFCIGQTSTPLSAVADGRLIWYKSADRSGSTLAQITPNTERANVTTYYVTQMDSYNCESVNSTLDVRVSEKSTARLTGDGDIYRGDSTAIRIRFTGDGPWSFTDWNDKPILATDSLYVKWEKPTTTRTYIIRDLKSTCGSGDIQNSYTLTVMIPLSAQPMTEPLFLNAYPNPATGDLNVDWRSPTKQTITLQLINAAGKVIEQVTRQATSGSQMEQLKISSQPAGTYILNVTTANNGKLTRRIVKQ